MSDTDLERLKSLNVAELRRQWERRFKKRNPPQTRNLLLRELAWEYQQKVHGGMDAQTRNLLRLAMRQAETVSTRSSPASQKQPRARKKPELKTGTKLVRTWRGKTYEVVVCDDGKEFQFRGYVYCSLTPVAKKITGAHWSGPRFFGLDRVRTVQ